MMKIKAEAGKQLVAEAQGKNLTFSTGGCVQFQAAAKEDSEEDIKERRFDMVAYSGGIAEMGYWGPMVFDLEGMDCPRQDIPALLHHNHEMIAGCSDEIENTGKQLRVKGRIFEEEPEGQKVLRLSGQGFPWQASVGLNAQKLEWIDEDEVVSVNGERFDGPLIVVRQSCLYEASFVPLGADSKSSAIAANLQFEKEPVMAEKDATISPDEFRKQERARIEAIEAAFPNDPKFALEHIKNGSTLLHAKAAYADVLQERQAAQQEEHAKAIEAAREEERKKARGNGPIPDGPGGAPAEEDDLEARWERAIEAQQSRNSGLTRRQATIAAARQHRKLHAEWLAAKNGGLSLQDVGLRKAVTRG